MALVIAGMLAAAAPASAVPDYGGLTPVGCIADVGSSICGAGNTSEALNGADDVAVSPDGKSVYVTSFMENAITRFTRNTATGILTPAGCIADVGIAACGAGNTVEGLDGVVGVAISPDGTSLYAVSLRDDVIVNFSRNISTGALTSVGCIADVGSPTACGGNFAQGLDQAGSVAISPDGKSVYVGANSERAVVRFNRASNGILTPAGCISDVGLSLCGAGNTQEGLTPVALAVSPDGKSLYVANDVEDNVVTFDRNATGALSGGSCIADVGSTTNCGAGNFQQGLNEATGIVASPDGKSVYAVGASDSAVVRFDRNAATSDLTGAGCISDAGNGTCAVQEQGMAFPGNLEISADGRSVYVGGRGDDALVRFRRNTTTGALTGAGCVADAGSSIGCASTQQGLDLLAGVDVSPDGKSVYVASQLDDAVVNFSRVPDPSDHTLIRIPGTGQIGNADPFPSTIQVTGLDTRISDVDVTLNGLSHTFPEDLDVVLQGPGGQRVMLMSDPGDSTDIEDLDLTFDDSAASQLSSAAPTSGTYRPTNLDGVSGADPTVSCNPGPQGAQPNCLRQTFNGTNPNGTWRLEIVDDGSPDTGKLAKGWSLDIETDIVAPTTTLNGPSGTITDPNPSFTFTANESATFECSIDDGDFSPCTSPRNLSGLTNGAHRLQVRATDLAGNVEQPGPVRSFTVSNGQPVTNNNFAIRVPGSGTSGNADPYPSTIDVAGLDSRISDVDVTLRGFAHTTPVDVDVLLQGPGGQRMILMSDSGGGVGNAVSGLDLTFDDSASATLPIPLTSGTFRPTNNAGSGSENFTGSLCNPGPETPSPQANCLTQSFRGTNPNGTWSLFVVDDETGDVGQITRGWSLDIETDIASPTTTLNGPSGNITDPNPSYDFTADESATFECSLDNADFTSCGSPMNLSGLAPGAHRFQVRATDLVGNVETSPVTRSFNVGPSPASNVRIRIPGTGDQGDAEPYPSTIEVSGLETKIADVNVNLRGLSHTFSEDVDVLLEGPGGQRMILMSDVGGTTVGTAGVTNADLTFDDDAAPIPAGALVGGVFRPTNRAGLGGDPGGTFCDPGTDPQSNCLAQSFRGTNPNGTWKLFVSDDGSGDTGQLARGWSLDITTDIAPPTTTLNGPSGNTTDPNPTFTFSANEPATFECSLDNANFTSCGSPMNLSGLAPGAHRFQVRASDLVGNDESGVVTKSFNVGPSTASNVRIRIPGSGDQGDADPYPSAIEVSGLETKIAEVDVTLRGLSHDFARDVDVVLEGPAGQRTILMSDVGGTGVASDADLTFDDGAAGQIPSSDGLAGGVFKPTNRSDLGSDPVAPYCNPGPDGADIQPTCLAQSFRGTNPNGTWKLFVSDDQSGDVGQLARGWSLNIDTDATADTAITSGPSGRTNNSSPSFEFTAGEAATFECSLDGATFTSCPSPKAYPALSDGAYTFEVRATDSLGNVDPSPASRTFVVDTAVDTSITDGPSGTTNVVNPSFEFTAGEAATFECSLDGETFAACPSPKAYPALSDGVHTFEVRATDSAGNVDSSPASRSFTLDATVDTSITAGPGGTSNNPNPSFEFNAGETATFECRLDGASFTSCPSPKSYPGLSDGAHTFQVRATDSAGNVDGTPASRTFTVDTTADTTITSGPNGTSNDPNPSFAFNAGESATFECRLDGETFASCSSPKAYSALSDGAHTFEVRATDSLGNVESTPASRSFTVDTAVVVPPPDPPTADKKVDGSAAAVKKQKAKGKKIAVVFTITAGEALKATAGGSIKLGKKALKLKTLSADVPTGSTTLKLKLAKSKDAKAIAKVLAGGKKAKATITVALSDAADNQSSQNLDVKLGG